MEAKQAMLERYDVLVSETLQQKNRMDRLHQETSTVHLHRTTSDTVTKRMSKMRSEMERFTETVLQIQKRVREEAKRRGIMKQKGGDLVIKQPVPLRTERSYSTTTSLKTTPLSPPLRSMSSSPSRRKDRLVEDAIKSLYLHESLMHRAEQSILEERQATLIRFIECMRSVSKVEQSIAELYPALAHLERSTKVLRADIERGQGATARKVITGYGILLIELWRRGEYSHLMDQRVDGGIKQLENIESKYRENFQKEISYLEKEQLLESSEEQMVIPFHLKDLDLATEYVITKKDVQDYIQTTHSFYAKNDPDEKPRKPRSDTRDVSLLLSQRFERESKRLLNEQNQLGNLGLSNRDEDIKVTSPSFSSHSQDMMISVASDWESEKTLLLRQAQEYKRYIEELRSWHDVERTKYEKNQQNLLREIGAKDKLLNKRVEEVKASLMHQIFRSMI
ncbi:hypothetical protein K501DRAFT_50515 [Backusella circina FSU 941]|nr:hypothetical protein K501DRAFT_50515 [Backusella circina FSU 941]